MVNAANSGGITGFGVDELVNRAGGNEIKDGRRIFHGIPTGIAKSIPSFSRIIYCTVRRVEGER
jgi:O-acetyl-ADP-ribose deacetylase (regulator of RNase III)